MRIWENRTTNTFNIQKNCPLATESFEIIVLQFPGIIKAQEQYFCVYSQKGYVVMGTYLCLTKYSQVW